MPDTNDNLDELERLDQYLDGQLTEDDRSALEQALEEDTSLRETLQLLRISRDAIRAKALQQKVHTLHQKWKPEVRPTANSATTLPTSEAEVVTMPPPVKPAASTTLFRTVWRVAAAVLIGLVGYSAYQFGSANHSTMYNEHYLSYELPRVRGNDEAVTNLDVLYDQQRYAEVLQAYERQTSFSGRDHFLAAMSALEQEDYTRAVDLFTQVRATASFEQETDYYLALAYLQTGQTDEARALFQKIAKAPRHLYHENASPQDLRSLWWLQWK